MVILVNNEIQSDAAGLVEGDTVLIFFRNVGLEYVIRSPPCSEHQFRSKQRAGCVYSGVPCITDGRNSQHYASTLLYYFRPVVVSDDGLTIKLTDNSRTVLNSVTFNGECIYIYIYSMAFLQYVYFIGYNHSIATSICKEF